MITSDQIKSRLWQGANDLRGSMDASRYKDYMLGLMFYKFLSDKTLTEFSQAAGLQNLTEVDLIKEYKKAHEQYGDELIKTLQSVLGYYVLPEYLYQSWLIDINEGNFEVQNVTDSLHNFERTIAVKAGSDDFKGLFSSSTIDFTDTALGSNLNERSKNIQALILLFEDLNMVKLQEGDILGDAYEYLIGQFAMESGKKAGEFYTPRQVSDVMARIVSRSSNIETIYDPTVGSGSLLLTVNKYLDGKAQKDLTYYGQERNTTTYNLTRMNLLLHGVRPEKMNIRNGDTLAEDWPEDPDRPNEGVLFDAVVMNPPYSVKNWNRAELKVSDPRFEIAGALPPNGKGDYAFLLHGLFHLGQQGTMAIVLPHGVLFRGGAEGEIRKRLIENNFIDTIIGLPSNLFTNTGIPVTVMILKKNRKLNDPVLVIDASDEFVKEGRLNTLLEKDIAKIVDTYTNRTNEEGYSYNATREEILENEYNMNIPRYVIKKDKEMPHDVDAHLYGGIPKKNIDDLKVLNEVAPKILNSSIKEIRPGYIKLNKSIEEFKTEVLASDTVLSRSNEMKKQIDSFINKYWDILINTNDSSIVRTIMADMLDEIKEILSKFKHIDIYDGYQLVAKMWEENLSKDIEMISRDQFYNLAKTREPNMVTKGSGKNKREEQDGWIGTLVPNDLIKKELYKEEIDKIETLNNEVLNNESELDEIVENAKIEETLEYEALNECFNASESSFLIGKINSELRQHIKGSEEYNLIKKAQINLSETTKIKRTIREEERELNTLVEERILSLINEEIDKLVYKKWFGGLIEEMIGLIEKPLKDEIDTLKLLNDRYKSTLDDLDEEYNKLETSFEELLSELVKL